MVRRRSWIRRCIAPTTRTKRYIAAGRYATPWCRALRCEEMSSTASDIMPRKGNQTRVLKIFDPVLGWNRWRCLLAFASCARQPQLGSVAACSPRHVTWLQSRPPVYLRVCYGKDGWLFSLDISPKKKWTCSFTSSARGAPSIHPSLFY